MGHYIAGIKLMNGKYDLTEHGHEDIIVASKQWVKEHIDEVKEWANNEQ